MTVADRTASPRLSFAAALRDAALTALVAFAIFLPLVGFETISNIRNELVLAMHGMLLFSLAAIIGVLRLGYALAIDPWMRRRALKPARVAGGWETTVKGYVVPFAIGLVVVYPVFVIWTGGMSSALKWVDNFGIQILIYVMLGWGLNIVVGLAGLLDLGYVAFYAVGAYSYALLAKAFGLSFWILLPLAGCLASFWGVLLGFPVLRLRGDYLAIVTLAFGEIIRIVIINFVALTNG
jgi:branched-chain amino acid transport system permease protein